MESSAAKTDAPAKSVVAGGHADEAPVHRQHAPPPAPQLQQPQLNAQYRNYGAPPVAYYGPATSYPQVVYPPGTVYGGQSYAGEPMVLVPASTVVSMPATTATVIYDDNVDDYCCALFGTTSD